MMTGITIKRRALMALAAVLAAVCLLMSCGGIPAYANVDPTWEEEETVIPEQTPENEPEMHVASTFRDVSDLLDEFHKRGIDEAEFCLVGWNKSGHDGRWPQAFPVEEKLGGEEARRKIRYRSRRKRNRSRDLPHQATATWGMRSRTRPEKTSTRFVRRTTIPSIWSLTTAIPQRMSICSPSWIRMTWRNLWSRPKRKPRRK